MEFFNKENNFTYTKEGRKLDNEVLNALRPIYEKWVAAGANPRDISYFVTHESIALASEMCIKMAMKNRKKDLDIEVKE